MSAAVAAPPLTPRARARVVIIGGGLAGLVTAYELEKHGIKAAILEADSVFGGRVQTAEYEGGSHAEYGMQELWSDNPLIQIAGELGIPLDANPAKPYSSVILQGKLYPYLRDSKEAFFNTFLTRTEKAQLLGWLDEAAKLRRLAESEGIKHPEVKKLESISFADWVESAHLPASAAELVRLHLECEVASNWHLVSALFGLLEFGMFLGEEKLANHVRGGNSQLIAGLVAATSGEKTLSALVTRIERQKTADGRIVARIDYLHDRRMYQVEAERVVVAVPFWRLHQIEMIPPLSDEKLQATATLLRGQYTVVHLLVQKDAKKLWMMGDETPLALLTDGPLGVVYGVVGPDDSAEANEVFSLLVHGQAAAAFHMMPRELKLKEIYTQLDKLWPGIANKVQKSYVYTYHPGAVPVWPPGRSPLDALSEKLREPELGLYLAGDYLYNAHSDGAARSGIRVAERIARELKSLSQNLLRTPSAASVVGHGP